MGKIKINFQKILGFFARILLKIKKPEIIGVSGTVGKTTVTSFVYQALLQTEKKSYRSPYNYNGEWGILFSIFMCASPGKNIFLWALLPFRYIKLLFLKYPKILVLEYGIDRPGEMKFLLSIVKPDIGILTGISPAHVDNFSSYDAYKYEKILFLQSAKKSLAHESLKKDIDFPVTFYGVDTESEIFAEIFSSTMSSIDTNISMNEKKIQISLPLFGEYQAINILPIFYIFEKLQLELSEKIFSDLHVEEGRGRILSGIKKSVIIDGSYNGGPASVTEGIRALGKSQGENEKILLLGDMRELADLTQEAHEKIAQEINKYEFDYIICVWEIMKKYTFSKIISQKKKHFLSSREAWKFIKNRILKSSKKNIIFVKGSQNTIFLEEAIEYLLEDNSDRKKLCRQGKRWKEKKEIFFKTFIWK